jgi:short subunit dehydrogenase
MGKLEGKIALVTGGNSGIGLASAKRFANEGAFVFITGRRDRELAAAVKEIGQNVTGVQGDVSNLADLDRLFAQIKREKGRLPICSHAGQGYTWAFRSDSLKGMRNGYRRTQIQAETEDVLCDRPCDPCRGMVRRSGERRGSTRAVSFGWRASVAHWRLCTFGNRARGGRSCLASRTISNPQVSAPNPAPA